MNKLIVGIDPGKNGAAAFIDHTGAIYDIIQWSKNTEHDIADAFIEYGPMVDVVYLENVASRPAQGVRSVFTFGTNFGFWQGLLTGLKLPYEKITPGTWQRSLKCLSQGDKNVTKRKAQQLFPNQKITHAVADAILIAEFGRRINT